jgi:hypothetical protein
VGAVIGSTWAAPLCGVCRALAVTVDMACGHRCAAHPPTYSAAYAAGLLRDGLPGAATAYYRTYLALLRPRTTDHQEAS